MGGSQKKIKCIQCQHDKKQCEWSSIIPLALLHIKFSIQQANRVDLMGGDSWGTLRRATEAMIVKTKHEEWVLGEDLVRLMLDGFNEHREPPNEHREHLPNTQIL